MSRKKKHLARNLLAGGAVLATVGAVAAPVMLGVGIKALRRAAKNYYLDLGTGRIRPKDENVIILEKSAYRIDSAHSEEE